MKNLAVELLLIIIFGSFFPTIQVVYSSTSGSLVGIISDEETNEYLPGVFVQLDGTQIGTQTSDEGIFFIHNIPIGTYDVQIYLIGYEKKIIKDVAISADRKTQLEVKLKTEAVPGEYVVVEAPAPMVRKDITASQFSVRRKEISIMPVTSVEQILTTKPGVVEGGHIRGGRAEEAVYVVDGIPINQSISGDLGHYIPVDAIEEMSVMTGGWDPEFGNASSGVINIITRQGSNNFSVTGKYENDHLFGGNRHNEYHRLLGNFSGHIVKNKLFYFGNLMAQIDNTRYWWDFEPDISRPLHHVYSGLYNLKYNHSSKSSFGLQLLFSDQKNQPYNISWRYNLGGLPREGRRSFRTVFNYSHNFETKTFVDFQFSWQRMHDWMNEASEEELASERPYRYDVFLLYVTQGDRIWWKRATENIYTMQSKLTTYRLFNQFWRIGAEFQYYDIDQDLIKYEPQRTMWGKPLVDEPQLNYSNYFHYQPYDGAVYFQTKWETPEKSLVNIGFRYDFLNPRASKPSIFVPSYLFEFSEDNITWEKASIKHQFSPRVGFGMPLLESSFIFINYGQFFQHPLFEYFYSGLNSNFQFSQRALIGNPDLPHMKSTIFEISYRQEFWNDYALIVTNAIKKTKNLVDVRTFVGWDSKIGQSRGYGQFVNVPFAEVNSFEVVLKKRASDWIWGELNYTYSIAQAISDHDNASFEYLQWGFNPEYGLYYVSWDQRHTINLNLNLKYRDFMNANIISRFATPRPYTYFPSRNGFVPDDPGIRIQPNNARMVNTYSTDVKVELNISRLLNSWPRFPFEWGFYVDIRNLFNRKNILWVTSNGVPGGELNDPDAYSEGQRIKVGTMINF